MLLQITQGGLSLPTREYYLPTNDSDSNFPAVVAAFKDMIVEVAALLAEDSVDDSDAKDNNDSAAFALTESARRRMNAAAAGVVALETRLAEVTIPLSQMRAAEDDQYHNMTLSELGQLAPFLDWTQFFASAFAEVGRTVEEDQVVVVYAPSYLGNLSAIIDEYLNNGTE